jgi:hypothetical protein
MFRHRDIVLLGAVLGIFAAMVCAPAHAAVIDGAAAGTATAQAAASAQTAPRYHLRCWQNGRLLFEQAVASLPADVGRSSTRLQAKDGTQEPVIVYETRNATCMARGLRVTR